MNPVSNTAYYCCGIRMEDAKRERSICNDTYAELFMDEKGMAVYEPFRTEKMPNICNATRCRIIDDLLTEQINANSNINIISIGAGFDTRPYRIAGGNWVEVDEAQVIEYKNQKLPIEECRNQLSRLSIDFSTESLTNKLANINDKLPVVIVIEGVFMYLNPEQIIETIKQLQARFPTHILFCDLMAKNFFDKFAASVHSKIVEAGAEFTERPERPETLFLGNNYVEIERIPMFRRALEMGTIWQQLKIPGFAFKLALNVFVKELNGYAIYHFEHD